MKLSSLALIFIWASVAFSSRDLRRLHRRQGPLLPVPGPAPPAESSPSGSKTPINTPAPTSTPNTTPATTSSSSSSSSSSASSETSKSSSSSSSSQSSPTTSSAPSKTSDSSVSLTTHASTDSKGNTIIVTDSVIVTPTPTPSPSAAPDPPKPIPQQTIIALAVSGGVAGLGLILFIVWKLNQKRFSQFDEDEDPSPAIKWPESQADAAGANRGDAAAAGGLGRSQTQLFTQTSAANSAPDLDPYVVPPLPGNYHDDPNIAAGGYYDPYRGPVPGSFASPPESYDGHAQGWSGQGEAIQMSNLAPASTIGRRPSPGPSMAYDDPYRRGSPAPYGVPPAIDRRSPGPQIAYSHPADLYGRGATPAPPQAYADHYAGRASPAMGRRSPGPNLPFHDPYGGIQ